MRLAEGVEWAAHCVVLMALLPEGETLPAHRLAEYHGVPAPYLAKCLQTLTTHGLVESRPGRGGGYRLGRPAATISLLDVVVAVEGSEPSFRCTEIRRRGPAAVSHRSYSPVCAIAGAMWRAEDAWREELARTTIEDLVHALLNQAPPRSLEKGALWLGSAVEARGGRSR